jgi:hypothetical protein
MRSVLVLCLLLALNAMGTSLAGTSPSDAAWLKAKAQEDVRK